MDLRHTAHTIAAGEGHRGAIVISVTDDGVRIETAGLTPDELRYALCAAFNDSFLIDGETEIEDVSSPREDADDEDDAGPPRWWEKYYRPVEDSE